MFGVPFNPIVIKNCKISKILQQPLFLDLLILRKMVKKYA